MMKRQNTIAAIVTPPGEGGVAIIRISGKDAVIIGNKVFSRDISLFESHKTHFGKILNSDAKIVDEGLLVVMRAPNSFTGEDVVEINCHGGSIVSKQVLSCILKAGAEMAEPGEFSLRAFFNGKMDLAQAEAVQDLIMAKNEQALKNASNQLQGSLSKKIQKLQEKLIEVSAVLEASVDFPDEVLELDSTESMQNKLQSIYLELNNLADTFSYGKVIHEGVALCLLGIPNVGKSSLMNALLEQDRAIVTKFPGTTRDTLDGDYRYKGINYRLVDTAGIRETVEEIEEEGIRRSNQAKENADIVLLVLDASRTMQKDEHLLLKELDPTKTIVVWNKVDLSEKYIIDLSFRNSVRLSAKLGLGVNELRNKIDEVLFKAAEPKDEVVLTNMRHKEAVDHSLESLSRVLEGLKNNVSEEFLSFDVRQSVSSLGRVIGLDVTDLVLTEIFSRFCIGK